MGTTFHRLILVPALIFCRCLCSVRQTMYQENAASCLLIQPNQFAGHILYQWLKNSPPIQNEKLLGVCICKTPDTTAAKYSFAVTCLSWAHFSELTAFEWKQSEGKERIRDWTVVFSITPRGTSEPGEEGGSLQPV